MELGTPNLWVWSVQYSTCPSRRRQLAKSLIEVLPDLDRFSVHAYQREVRNTVFRYRSLEVLTKGVAISVRVSPGIGKAVISWAVVKIYHVEHEAQEAVTSLVQSTK